MFTLIDVEFISLFLHAVPTKYPDLQLKLNYVTITT